jgi:hypothetical protein
MVGFLLRRFTDVLSLIIGLTLTRSLSDIHITTVTIIAAIIHIRVSFLIPRFGVSWRM